MIWDQNQKVQNISLMFHLLKYQQMMKYFNIVKKNEKKKNNLKWVLTFLIKLKIYMK